MMLTGIVIGVSGTIVTYVVITHGWGWVLAAYHKYVNPQ